MERVFDGVITKMTAVITGQKKDGGTWSKQEFVVVNENGKYPEYAIFCTTPETIARFKEGMPVSIKYNFRAREYKGKWYGENWAWGIYNQESEKKSVKKQAQVLNGDMANEFNKSQKIEDHSLGLPF